MLPGMTDPWVVSCTAAAAAARANLVRDAPLVLVFPRGSRALRCGRCGDAPTALPESSPRRQRPNQRLCDRERQAWRCAPSDPESCKVAGSRSEEHTSELQSRLHLVCRILLDN